MGFQCKAIKYQNVKQKNYSVLIRVERIKMFVKVNDLYDDKVNCVHLFYSFPFTFIRTINNCGKLAN